MEVDNIRNITGTMVKIMRLHRYNCEKKMRECGVQHSQHRLLMYIYRCGENAPTQVQIAQFFSISAAAVAVAMRKLEAEGFIVRKPRQDDLRNNEVIITEKGKNIAELSAAEFDGSDATMYSGFSEEELLQLRGFLDRMRGNLERGNR